MATQAQIDANRANAQKSSGPVSEEGKAASSQNRASHRMSHHATFQVLDQEDQSLYSLLVIDLLIQFDVASDDRAERAIVERMAQHEWMRRRALNSQDWIFNDREIFRMEQLKLYMSYEAQHERAYNACFKQLLTLRAERRSVQIGFERQKQVKVQAVERTQRHEITQKARQVDIDCKIARTLSTTANNPEALDVARKVKTRHQTA